MTRDFLRRFRRDHAQFRDVVRRTHAVASLRSCGLRRELISRRRGRPVASREPSVGYRLGLVEARSPPVEPRQWPVELRPSPVGHRLFPVEVRSPPVRHRQASVACRQGVVGHRLSPVGDRKSRVFKYLAGKCEITHGMGQNPQDSPKSTARERTKPHRGGEFTNKAAEGRRSPRRWCVFLMTTGLREASWSAPFHDTNDKQQLDFQDKNVLRQRGHNADDELDWLLHRNDSTESFLRREQFA